MAKRSPAALKKKGPWSLEEDIRLISYISLHGQGRWDTAAKASGLMRSGRSCRLRWVNYLRPDLNITPITPEEERLIIHLHSLCGNRWSRIAGSLPGRTDNAIKNHWRTHLKKTNHMQESGSRMDGDHLKESGGSMHGCNHVEFESLIRSSSIPTSFRSLEDLENNIEETSAILPKQSADSEGEVPLMKDIREPAICDSLYEFESNEGNPDPCYEVQSSTAMVLDGLQEYSMDLNTMALSCLFAEGKMPYYLYNTAPSPDTYSLTDFYTDELWNMDEEDNVFIFSPSGGC